MATPFIQSEAGQGLIGGVFSLANTGLQMWGQKKAEERQAKYNKEAAELQQGFNQDNMNLSYQLGEQSAENADARTRALYDDLYSPEAKVKQLKNAGLSVGLMYGNGGGISGSGQSGAQGNSPAALPTTVQPAIAKNPFEEANLGLTFAQIQKTLAEANAINKETGREEGKYDFVLQQMEAQIKETNALIDSLKEQTENYKAERKLTNLQSDYQELVNGIKNQTAQFDITKVMQECEYMDEQITSLKKGNYWKDEQTKTELDKMLEETKTIRLQRTVMEIQKEYYQAMTEQSKSQAGLNESLTRKTDKEIEEITKNIALKAAEIENIEERTKYIEKEYKLKMGIQITNTVLNGILGTVSAIKGTPFVPLSTQSDATITNIR